jgi:hypothetical protein
MPATTDIPEDRPLTAAESALIRWLLQNGIPQAAEYLPQLDRARVVSRCACGCASIDFAINGVIPPAGGGMNILADYEWRADGGALFGVFVFARVGVLAGLDVWSQDGLAPAVALPEIEQLRPLGMCQIAEPG